MDAFQSPESAEIARKRRMAELLMQQSGMPQGQMVSGHYVAPAFTQQLASALNMYKGRKTADEADTAEIDLARAMQEGRQKWMSEMPRATDNTSQAGPAIPQQPNAEDYMSWATKGMAIDPRSAQMGMQSANMAMNRDAQAQARAQQEQLRRDQLAQQAQQAEEQRALQRELAQMRAQQGQQGGSPYFTPVQSAQGIYAFNNRTGKMEMVPGAGGAPVIGAQADPALQGRIAGAKEGAELEVKSGAEAKKAVRKSDVMLEQLDQAEGLLKQGPTSSGVGAGVDALGNLVGVSSKSADTAAKLASISGWLVANVPRMEGPQSNFDVQNYQTMAGLVGDKTKPVSQRMAALAEVRKLQEKYKQLNQEVVAGPSTEKSAPKRIRFDAQGNEIK